MFGELNLEIANEEKLIKYGTNVELISFGIWKLRFNFAPEMSLDQSTGQRTVVQGFSHLKIFETKQSL